MTAKRKKNKKNINYTLYVTSFTFNRCYCIIIIIIIIIIITPKEQNREQKH